ncbi:MAG: DMT family transporter [Lachnospiraceae bacterium]|nr:DMT family transporter [Lachnospiraceae bacterium]
MTERNANLLLVSVALVWGASGTLMKIGIGDITPFSLIALRFGIAFFIMMILFWKKVYLIGKRAAGYSFLMGSAMFFTFAFLMYGLKTTPASTAGFLTGTAVVMVPLLELMLFRKFPAGKVWIAMIIVLAGISLLSLNEELSIGTGEIFCIIASLFNAIYIIMTGHFSKKEDPLQLGIWQLFSASLWGAVCAATTSGIGLPKTQIGWITVLSLALLCSAYGYVIQPLAQKYTTPEKTGFILASEPVFSLAFASLILGESFTEKEALGAALIFVSILVVNGRGFHLYKNTQGGIKKWKK